MPQTNTLIGLRLDYAVACCEFYRPGGGERDFLRAPYETMSLHSRNGKDCCELRDLAYSTDWALAGPIIEHHIIGIVPNPLASDENLRWEATCRDRQVPITQTGPTPLVAAMRCYVASRYGSNPDSYCPDYLGVPARPSKARKTSAPTPAPPGDV